MDLRSQRGGPGAIFCPPMTKLSPLLARTVAAALVFWTSLGAAAQPVIAEFMAINDSGLIDADRDHEDWIEIWNPTGAAIPLGGHYLTDNDRNLTKWKVPAPTSLAPGGRLIVFASGKDRAEAGKELHANFKLAGSGEYLALVAPDGGTVLSDFGPEYPRQFEDVSYGHGVRTGPPQMQKLLKVGDQGHYFVPKPSDPEGGDWREAAYDHSQWQTGASAFGFGYSNQPIGQGGDLGPVMHNLNNSIFHGGVYVRQSFEIVDPVALVGMTLRMKYDDGFVAYLNGKRIAAANAPETLTRTSVATGNVQVGDDDIFESFPVAYSGKAVAGQNVLAIHGLNRSHGDSDFLLIPELEVSLKTGQAETITGYFESPTPRRGNGIPLTGFIKDPTFSETRGFFDAPFELELASETPDVKIRYTVDGREPTATSGAIYTKPITIARTTILRVAAFAPGLRSSNVETQSYFFVNDIVRQRNVRGAYWDSEMDPNVVSRPGRNTVQEGLAAIPSLSIVMDPADLFGSRGIYSNATQRASDNPTWEKACSAEYFYHPDYDGPYRIGNGFKIKCGIAINGNFSRLSHNPKHSFRLKFKDQYGPPKLDFPVFPNSPVDEYDTLVIRTGHNQGWATGHGSTQMMRNQYARDIQGLDPSQTVADGNHVHLYLNGQYWGLYNFHERPDDSFGAEHYGGKKSEYDGFKGLRAGGSTQARLVSGNRNAWVRMFSLANRDMTRIDNYEAVLAFVDVDQLIDYMIGILYTGDRDGPTGIYPPAEAPKNFYAMRRRHVDGRFRFFRWDSEFIFESTGTDMSERGGPENPAGLHKRLRGSPEYRLRFADRVHRYFFNEGKLTPTVHKQFYMDRSEQVNVAMVAESARWGDSKREPPFTRDGNWVNERNRIVNSWMPGRHNVIINQFKNDRLYPNVDAPTLRVNNVSRIRGPVPGGARLTMTAPRGLVYYTTDGSDPRLAPARGVAGNVPSANAVRYDGPIDLTESGPVKARVLSSGQWSALVDAEYLVDSEPASSSNLVISEFNYRPGTPTDVEQDEGYDQRKHFEWIELLNVGARTVDLTGVIFSDAINFNFDRRSAISYLKPGTRLLVVKNRDAFRFRYPEVDPALIAGEYGMRLSDDGETIVLTGPEGEIANFTYNDRGGWPEVSDGDGPTLVLRRPGKRPDTNQLSAWRPSVAAGGSPGGDDSISLAAWLAQEGIVDPHRRRGGAPLTPFQRYAFGGEEIPLVEIRSFEVEGVEGDYLTFTYRRNAAADDLTFAPEVSGDLINWFGEPRFELVSREWEESAREVITVRESSPVALGEDRFFRVQIDHVP